MLEPQFKYRIMKRSLSWAALAWLLSTLNQPASSAVAQNIYVANDSGPSATAFTILKFDPSGNGAIWAPNNGWSGGAWEVPSGLALDSAGNLYVAYAADTNAFIKKFDAQGTGARFATLKPGSSPSGIALDAQGNLYIAINVANASSGTIEKFSASGTDLGAFGDAVLQWPDALTFDKGGNLYVSDLTGAKIWKFSPGGHGVVFVSGDNYRGLAFDSQTNLYVGVGWSIDKFDATGASLGVLSPRSGEFAAEGLAFDGDGNLFMSDYLHGTICRFDPLGHETTFATVTFEGQNDLEFLAVQSVGPQLDLSRTRSGKVVLSWPSTASAWVLQSATTLWPVSPSSANWTDLAVSPAISGGQCLVTNAVSGKALFYRLRKP